MESASDRSPDPNRTNHDARHPLPARLQEVSPDSGSGRGSGHRSNHQELLGRQDVRSSRLERGIAERA